MANVEYLSCHVSAIQILTRGISMLTSNSPISFLIEDWGM